MFCPQCGNASTGSAKFCVGCGFELPQLGRVVSEVRVRERASGEQDEFYKAAIGDKNQAYYLRHFQRFDSQGKIGATWNWPAFFITFYWLLYRKMWLSAAIYFFSPYLVMFFFGIVAGIMGTSGDAVVGLGYIVYLAGAFLILPAFANALYFKHCKKKIAEARASSPSPEGQLGALHGKGGTSNAALIVALLFVSIAIIGVIAAISIPAYQEYATRARVSEAAATGNAAAESVARYVYQYQTVPANIEQAGFGAQLPASVQTIGVEKNGIVFVTLAAAPIAGKSLLLVPSLDTNNRITWSCTSQDIPSMYLPPQCKKQH